MNILFSPEGWEDYCSWVDDRRVLKRINRLIEESMRDPAVGIGKPEPLTQNLSGYWSRRITEEHRLVYRVTDSDQLLIVQVRGHY